MEIQPRLFARCLQSKNDSKKITSEPNIIVLSDLTLEDDRLQFQLKNLPNCIIIFQSTPNDCLKLINGNTNNKYSIYLVGSNEFINTSREILNGIACEIKCIYLGNKILCTREFLINTRLYYNPDEFFSYRSHRYDVRTSELAKSTINAVHYIEDNETTKYIWYRFFFSLLDRLEHTDIASREMMLRIHDIYGKNPYLSRDIDEFEKTYRSDKIISLYTQKSFVYRILNEALRGGDINDIFPIRVIIRDLGGRLRSMHSEQVKTKIPCLYRGQKLHIDQVNRQRANIGKSTMMNSYVSATTSICAALAFSRNNGSIQDQSITSVIYRINVKPDSKNVILADIQQDSAYAQEQEWLFSMRSLFRINQVVKISDRYHIDLTAIDENDPQLSTIINQWNETMDEQNFFSNHQQRLLFRTMHSDKGSFLAFQLFIDIILRLDQTEFAREEMIEVFRKKRAHRPTDLIKIDEFERNYRHEDAIKWYTANCFLYRVLRGALGSQDINTIFKLRYYIYDLHNQLAKGRASYIQSLPKNKPLLTLYRGQRMSMIDLKKLQDNVGDLISFNSFLSTTNSCEAALFFAGCGQLSDSVSEVSVLYQITVDTRTPHSIPFAKIQYESIFKDEEEVLFSMASVFRVDTIEQYGPLWVVDLSLIDKEDEHWSVLTAHLNQ